ncbi:MAG TPA: zf-HC2 domain-containing protein [Solirubrobacteraceae bacterium]|nr:zf-HC2 domain-containing protein [Solirubrobacteraceae bacterium]
MSELDDISCRELVELVSDYFEGALTASDRARLESHVARCANCAAYVRQMRETITLMGRLPTQTLSVETEAQLRVAFREWKARG